jgi:riboflavin kinase/FMN adenylyltransferase
MKLYEGMPDKGLFDGPVVTIGNFDGVHLGHRLVFDSMREIALKAGKKSVAVSFRVHPRKVLFPERPVPLLVTPEERISLIAQSGIDALVLLDFTEELSRMHAFEFARMMLVDRLHASHIVFGYDHAFGKNREGNVDSLVALSEQCDFEITRLKPLVIDGHPVSSSRIRTLLGEGDVGMASRYLGRYYSTRGIVEKGYGRGRAIGVPTANIAPGCAAKIIPADGVYAARVTLGETEDLGAVVNVGNNPTFGGERRTIEAHILDFNRDVYGEMIDMMFIAKIRNEERFASADDLVRAINSDIERARGILR